MSYDSRRNGFPFPNNLDPRLPFGMDNHPDPRRIGFTEINQDRRLTHFTDPSNSAGRVNHFSDQGNSDRGRYMFDPRNMPDPRLGVFPQPSHMPVGPTLMSAPRFHDNRSSGVILAELAVFVNQEHNMPRNISEHLLTNIEAAQRAIQAEERQAHDVSRTDFHRAQEVSFYNFRRAQDATRNVEAMLREAHAQLAEKDRAYGELLYKTAETDANLNSSRRELRQYAASVGNVNEDLVSVHKENSKLKAQVDHLIGVRSGPKHRRTNAEMRQMYGSPPEFGVGREEEAREAEDAAMAGVSVTYPPQYQGPSHAPAPARQGLPQAPAPRTPSLPAEKNRLVLNDSRRARADTVRDASQQRFPHVPNMLQNVSRKSGPSNAENHFMMQPDQGVPHQPPADSFSMASRPAQAKHSTGWSSDEDEAEKEKLRKRAVQKPPRNVQVLGAPPNARQAAPANGTYRMAPISAAAQRPAGSVGEVSYQAATPQLTELQEIFTFDISKMYSLAQGWVHLYSNKPLESDSLLAPTYSYQRDSNLWDFMCTLVHAKKADANAHLIELLKDPESRNGLMMRMLVQCLYNQVLTPKFFVGYAAHTDPELKFCLERLYGPNSLTLDDRSLFHRRLARCVKQLVNSIGFPAYRSEKTKMISKQLRCLFLPLLTPGIDTTAAGEGIAIFVQHAIDLVCRMYMEEVATFHFTFPECASKFNAANMVSKSNTSGTAMNLQIRQARVKLVITPMVTMREYKNGVMSACIIHVANVLVMA